MFTLSWNGTDRLAHEINPDFKVGCMIATMTGYPLTCHPKDVIAALQHEQVKNMFCSDVMIRGDYPSYSKRYFEEHNISIQALPEDTEVLKKGCVGFYSCSYYQTLCVSGRDEGDGKLTAAGCVICSIVCMTVTKSQS